MTLVMIRSLQLEIPRIHSKHGESAFSYYAQIRCAPTVVTFKSRLKTHLFSYVLLNEHYAAVRLTLIWFF